MTPLRCYNCGLIGHRTQNCPSFGPRYPAPGKIPIDYAEETAKISQLFAADILAEHDHGELDEGPVLRPNHKGVARPASEQEQRYREAPCSYCRAVEGDPCRSKSGEACASHSARKDLYWLTVKGS